MGICMLNERERLEQLLELAEKRVARAIDQLDMEGKEANNLRNKLAAYDDAARDRELRVAE